nr:MAG TPA: hypothetical protein [Caudoviricetes sp.]
MLKGTIPNFVKIHSKYTLRPKNPIISRFLTVLTK